jgi:hypothetical protein
MLSDAERREFAFSCEANRCFLVNTQQFGNLTRCEESLEGRRGAWIGREHRSY